MNPLNPLMRVTRNSLLRNLLALATMYLVDGKIIDRVVKIPDITPYLSGFFMSGGDGVNAAGMLRETMNGNQAGNFYAFIRSYRTYWEMMQ